MKRSPQAPALVLSPHPDDAVLGCWSVLARGGVRVVNVFDALPPSGFVALWDALTGATDSRARLEERLEEDRLALALARVEPSGLGFLDNQYLRGGPAPGASEIREALEAAVPSASAIYAPAGLGAHPDHQLVSRVAVDLAYDGFPVTLFAELPYSTDHGWPHWVTGEKPDPHLDPDSLWETFLEELPCHRTALVSQVRHLTPEEAERKLEAMRAYRTQFPALNGGANDRLANPAIRRYEVFWQVRVPGGEMRVVPRRARLARLIRRSR